MQHTAVRRHQSINFERAAALYHVSPTLRYYEQKYQHALLSFLQSAQPRDVM